MDGTPGGSSLDARVGLLQAHRSLWLLPYPSWRGGVPSLPGVTKAAPRHRGRPGTQPWALSVSPDLCTAYPPTPPAAPYLPASPKSSSLAGLDPREGPWRQNAGTARPALRAVLTLPHQGSAPHGAQVQPGCRGWGRRKACRETLPTVQGAQHHRGKSWRGSSPFPRPRLQQMRAEEGRWHSAEGSKSFSHFTLHTQVAAPLPFYECI